MGAVYNNNDIEDWLRTLLGVRQGYLLSQTLINILIEQIM